MGQAGQGGFKKSKPIPALLHGAKISPSSQPHHFCGAGKTHIGRNREGRVKQSETKLPSLLNKYKYIYIYIYKI